MNTTNSLLRNNTSLVVDDEFKPFELLNSFDEDTPVSFDKEILILYF